MIKSKIKPLLPSLREKKRYLAFEIISKAKIKRSDSVFKAITASAVGFMGELGCSKAGIKTLNDRWDEGSQKGVLRVSSKYVDATRTAISLVRQIDDNEVIVRTIGVSGILKKATQKFLLQKEG